MNLNELIEKYKANIIECDRVIKAYQLCEKTRNIHKGIKQASKEILSDLKELKESVNALDITSINAPNSVVVAIIKKEIIGD